MASSSLRCDGRPPPPFEAAVSAIRAAADAYLLSGMRADVGALTHLDEEGTEWRQSMKRQLGPKWWIAWPGHERSAFLDDMARISRYYHEHRLLNPHSARMASRLCLSALRAARRRADIAWAHLSLTQSRSMPRRRSTACAVCVTPPRSRWARPDLPCPRPSPSIVSSTSRRRSRIASLARALPTSGSPSTSSVRRAPRSSTRNCT